MGHPQALPFEHLLPWRRTDIPPTWSQLLHSPASPEEQQWQPQLGERQEQELRAAAGVQEACLGGEEGKPCPVCSGWQLCSPYSSRFQYTGQLRHGAVDHPASKHCPSRLCM
ncbi:hypothetical protein E2320_002470 [Naja naja]|nr:hypothetical protein E2320_002470 [Naja naja]